MEHLSKKDLAQINRTYLESLTLQILIDLLLRLRDLAVELYERLEKNSTNSSMPPSSDNPFRKAKKQPVAALDDEDIKNQDATAANNNKNDNNQTKSDKDSIPKHEPDKSGRNAGKQPGSQGFGRIETPKPESIVPHYPEECAICRKKIESSGAISPYMGYYVYEIEKTDRGIRIACRLHHYFAAVCDCGHTTTAKPGVGIESKVEGRKKNLKLTEYVMIGPMFATLIAALSVRFRMSRPKIKEFLSTWLDMELSVGSIDRCIREAGIACRPVVDELIEELQEENIVGMDESVWYERGCIKWLWVAVSKGIAIFYIGTRKKEELLNLITSAFLGWLITDGYLAYRSHEKRQRCLAHLIRKAVALSESVDEKAEKMGDWMLQEMRRLIKTMSEDGENAQKNCSLILARLKKACKMGSNEDHSKLKSLAKEILNDWDAVVAFVKNPELPPTNNDAERALRHAVISRRISFGTRTSEGSLAYACLLSVIETCKRRNQDPWQYIAQTIARARKGDGPIRMKA